MASKIATAYVQIIPSARGMPGALSQIFDAEMPGAGKKAGGSFGASLVGTLKSVITVAAVGKVLSDSIMAGGALEQSLGGVETLFKDSADTVIANAQQAYKTAGMSANAYMETVTGFSASLLQSLGGDTQKAATVADMALIDMADNANKMGTSMESIQNAYQGFAKQNYTMLDNLKLGYGGTKSEMERLLSDAQKLTGVKYDIKNLSDVYEAIHVIQDEIGITGATAGEAATTLTGSFNAMKAAFTDVMGNIALGMDIGPSLNALAETSVTFLVDNLLPAIWNILTALPGALFTFIGALIPENMMGLVTNIVTNFSTFITTQLPVLVSSGTQMIAEFTSGFFTGTPGFFAVVSDVLTVLLTSILTTAPELLDSGVTLIGELARGFFSNLPALVSAAVSLLMNVVSTIGAHGPQLLQQGIELIGKLAAGLISAIPTAVAAIPKILSSIVQAFISFDWLGIGGDIVSGIAKGILNGGGAIVTAAKDAATSAYRSAKKALGIASPSKVMRDEVGKWIPAGMAVGIKRNTGVVDNAMTALADHSTNKLQDALRMDTYVAAAPKKAAPKTAPTIIINVYGAEGQNIEELADLVAAKLQNLIARKEMVYA